MPRTSLRASGCSAPHRRPAIGGAVVSRGEQRDRARAKEPERLIAGGRPRFEIRCFYCGRKIAEVDSLKKKGVAIKCRCGRLTNV